MSKVSNQTANYISRYYLYDNTNTTLDYIRQYLVSAQGDYDINGLIIKTTLGLIQK